MTYECPACGAGLDVHRSAGGTAFMCDSCGLDELVTPAGSDDGAYLEACVRHDEGRTGSSAGARGGGAGEARPMEEIDEMVGDAAPPGEVDAALRSRRAYLAQYRLLKGREPDPGEDIDAIGVDSRIAARLRERGISRLYAYQSEAIRLVLAGKSVAIEAPTAFGKTEAFLVPVAHLASGMRRAQVCAIFAYPTKALSRDQLPKIAALAVPAGMRAAVIDGDTPPAERDALCKRPPEMLITNFDLLHHQMLRRGPIASILHTARFLVVDEAHEYTGVFGSNVHHIVARLKRLTGPIQCVTASATLGDSGRFCSELLGQEMAAVRAEGRRADVDYAIMGPVGIPRRRLAVSLAKRMAGAGRKTMVFSNSHRGAELACAEARGSISIDTHRGGLEPSRVRDVEARFRAGGLDAISCTSTMELGVDIGAVDCVISEAIPHKRFMQRMGRAGRTGRRGCAFLVLGGDPISQYYMANPGDYEHDEEAAHIDATNAYVEEHQVAAMAADRPLTAAEEAARAGAVARAVAGGLLERARGGLRLTDAGRLTLGRKYSIRGIGGAVEIYAGGKRVGRREMPIALTELHEDAIYMLGGRAYRVARLRYPRSPRAEIEPLAEGTRRQTRAVCEDWPEVTSTLASRACHGMQVEFCALRIKKVVRGYVMLEGPDDAFGEPAALERPLGYTFVTKGIRFRAPAPAGVAGADAEVAAGAYHAAEHVIIEGSRMVIGASPADLGGMSMGSSGMIYVYDGAAGGSGASRALYERMERAVARARDIVSGCACDAVPGCPRCTMSYRCGNNNQCLHKAGALESLRRVTDGEVTATVETGEADVPVV